MSKLNPKKEIKILGKTYLVKFSLGTLAKIEDLTGHNPFSADFWKELSPKKIVCILYALIYKQEKNLTLEDFAEEIGLDEIQTLGDVLAELFAEAKPEQEESSGNSEEKKD